MVTSLLSVCLSVCLFVSLSLSLSLSLPPSLLPSHRAHNIPSASALGTIQITLSYKYYRKRGSASYIVREVLSVREREREIQTDRERERDGSDVTIFALKLAMNLHFPMPKIRTMAMSLHFPLPKIRTFRFSLHTSRLSLHGEVTIVALKFATSSHFPLPKKISPSLFPLFQMARAARRGIENPRQMIKSCPVTPRAYFVLPIEKLNQINTKNYWK